MTARQRLLNMANGRRVLLLQGPLGPFFWRLGRLLLREAGAASVHKINFNGGDCLFYPTGATLFRGAMEEWPDFLADFLRRERIEVILLFGDCREIHLAATAVASSLGVKVGVFEEGYVRPNFITFEAYGVNAYSRVPRQAEFYRHLSPAERPPEQPVRNPFWFAATWAILYYLAATLLWPLFPRYRHHRRLNALLEAWPWARSFWRKHYYAQRERGWQEKLCGPYARRFYLVPLQVASDFQVRVHSSLGDVERFLAVVVKSFARHAPDDCLLVIKHHPMDRGYRDYTETLAALARRHRIAGRVVYLHDQHLPSLLDHARGVVTINSTVGISALYHGAPVVALGRAIYHFQGLTYQGKLDHFWHKAPHTRPDPVVFQRFRRYLIDHTQINGSVYRFIF
ncbi:MAG: capsular biosynthesis protein [Giesbergeria sp.]|uniref:capsule biosynthesis protein n=1 Tax=Giesbergeria sp. TaxID=2818473 RepID=UPI002617B110|nr:capsular biosynthesis protein [Giesbergeria sp.]MDD2608873.1 capsular biosynthesis protein [Giesbergeria sp.]